MTVLGEGLETSSTMWWSTCSGLGRGAPRELQSFHSGAFTRSGLGLGLVLPRYPLGLPGNLLATAERRAFFCGARVE